MQKTQESSEHFFSISIAAQRAGCSAATLRNLERDGVIAPTRVPGNGLRLFTDSDLKKIEQHRRRHPRGRPRKRK